MMKNNWWKAPALAGIMMLAACGQSVEDGDVSTTQDGVQKTFDGKGDAWNWRNNPGRFQTELDYAFDSLPSEGASDRVGWAASYWPYYEDGINARWQGEDIMSPAEKYDTAFNQWTAPDGFMDLKPWDSWTCEYDEAYYEALGPAAEWTNKNKGTWVAHNGIDDDGDGVEDKDECREDRSEYDGLESWWGICHAWSPAAIMEDEPLKAVEHNGVTFEVSDMKALLIQQYDRTSAYMIGGRCNDRELERDENGRVTNEECRDMNAGSWHVVVTNFLGKNNRPFVIERTTDYQVWNQPLVGYEISEQREITLAEAHELLDLSADELGDGTGEFVFGIEEGSPLALSVLEFVNTASLTALDDDARLYSTAASEIVDARPLATLQELDAVPYVGQSAFKALATYVTDEGLVPSIDYKYNANATRFVEVRMTTDWVAESSPSVNPTTPVNDRYMHHDNYHYVLELDDAGEILGGEWLGSSNTNHPDFVWLPVATRGGNPHIDIDEVRALIAESRQTEDGGDDDGGANSGSFTSTDVIDIPDNDPAGVSSVLVVTDSGAVNTVKVDLEIDHTYRGDLLVQLAHGGVVVTVYDGQQEAQPWDDDVNLSELELDGFLGADLQGEWELRVYDSMGADVGKVVSWTLHASY